MPTKAQCTIGRTPTSFKFAPDILAALEVLKARHGGNRTAAIEALVCAAGTPTLVMEEAEGRPGMWLPASPDDLRLLYRVQEPRDGERSPAFGDPAEMVARAPPGSVSP